MNNWLWLRIYRSARSKDDLLLDAVRPLMHAAEGLALFDRSWLGGSNVVVGLQNADPGRLAEPLAVVRDYLQQHPSCTPNRAEEYLATARDLADWERQTEIPPLHADDSVEVGCPEPTSPLLGTGELRNAVRTFLSRSSLIVFEWLEAVRQGQGSRQEFALRALIALVWTVDPERLTAAISFGSHSGGFLRKADAGNRLFHAFAERYAGRDGEAARALVRATTAHLERGEGSLPLFNNYRTLIRETLLGMHEALLSGRYQAASVKRFTRDQKFGTASLSEHDHRRLITLLDESPALRAWQITINLVYMMLKQLGITALERFFGCYLLYCAIQDVYAQPWQDISLRLARSGDVREILPFFNEEPSEALRHVLQFQ